MKAHASLASFCLATVLMTLVRTAQKLWWLDPQTGFYEGPTGGFWLSWGMLILAGTAIFFVTREAGPDKLSEAPLKGSIPLGALSILLGCAVEFSSYRGALDTLGRIGPFTPKVVFSWCSVLMGILAGIVFLALGVQYLRNPRRPTLGGTLLAVPLFWMIPLLIDRFSSYTSIKSIVDQQYFVLFMVFGILFLLEHGRMQCGMAQYNSVTTAVFGLLCALCGLSLSLSQLITGLGWGVTSLLSSADLLLTLCFSLYCGAYACSLCLGGDKGDLPATE